MKKGSLNMSINTIVVLVLAMTLLGFGLMFVRGIFSKATSQFEQVGGDVEKLLKEKLTESNARITLSNEDLRIKKGNKKVVYFAIRNDLESDTTFYINNAQNTGYINSDGSKNDNLNIRDEGTIQCFTSDNPDICNGECQQKAYQHIVFKTIGAIKIKSNDVKVFPLTVEVKSNAAAETTYYCKFIIGCDKCESEPYVEKEFTVFVTS